MNCDQADELMSDLIDDEIAEADRTALTAHVSGCPACASSLKQLQRSVRFVRANGSVPLREGTPGAQYMEFTRAMMLPDGDATAKLRSKGYIKKEDGQ